MATFLLPHGLLIAFFLFLQFMIYEYVEETKIRDELYFEVQEWALGYAVGLCFFIVQKFFS